MTEQTVDHATPSNPPSPVPRNEGEDSPNISRTIDRLAKRLAPSPGGTARGSWYVSPGERAELRRMRPEDPPPPIFWQLLVEHLEPHLPTDTSPRRNEQEKRWMVILRALAELAGQHLSRREGSGGGSLGRALARAKVKEKRLYQLLRARGEALVDQLRMTLHQVATRGVEFDQADIAWLVLSEGTDGGEAVRRRIARNYFQAQRQQQQDQDTQRSEA